MAHSLVPWSSFSSSSCACLACLHCSFARTIDVVFVVACVSCLFAWLIRSCHGRCFRRRRRLRVLLVCMAHSLVPSTSFSSSFACLACLHGSFARAMPRCQGHTLEPANPVSVVHFHHVFYATKNVAQRGAMHVPLKMELSSRRRGSHPGTCKPCFSCSFPSCVLRNQA